MTVKRAATAEDLRRVANHGKAELADGEVQLMSPTGGRPGRAGGKIYASLLRHEEEVGGGFALPDNVGFLVDLPNRQSFSPDAAWYTGATIGMDFLQGAPAFAVEVRSEGDYGPTAERQITEKIVDYFAAGTLVVWDVDLLGQTIRKYTPQTLSAPSVFRPGEIADAEPAAPGWRLEVDRVFQ